MRPATDCLVSTTVISGNVSWLIICHWGRDNSVFRASDISLYLVNQTVNELIKRCCQLESERSSLFLNCTVSKVLKLPCDNQSKICLNWSVVFFFVDFFLQCQVSLSSASYDWWWACHFWLWTVGRVGSGHMFYNHHGSTADFNFFPFPKHSLSL